MPCFCRAFLFNINMKKLFLLNLMIDFTAKMFAQNSDDKEAIEKPL